MFGKHTGCTFFSAICGLIALLPGWQIHGGELPDAKTFWSFQPIHNPPVPMVAQTSWPRSPVDYFVLAKQEEKKLSPAPDADKRTLIRRATFDLIGLPPTPQEISDFLNDTSSDAFATVVDRLLSSRHYGERWGRHWLDVVRYADTAGETADYPVPQAYLYRNYVIDSFNQDKPYDQFIREQIAGDILAQRAPREKYAENVIATGYLALSRRFGTDSESYQHLTIEDTIGTLGKSILGLTLGCARCHDHKFDPVTMSDYYALYGIFSSTRYAHAGSEQRRMQRDFVPLLPQAEVEAILKPYKDQLRLKLRETGEAGAGATEQTNDYKLKPPHIDKAYGVSEGRGRNARIQQRGDPENPGPEVPRRFLQVFGGQELPPDTTESGRLQLAGWLTTPKNPLTARVMVNRIWQHHFGSGIVRSPNDFGKQGRVPTHPELLDYLANQFVAGGWSIKSVHRLIMLSHVYQLSSDHLPENHALDPDDELLWNYPRQRLDAESLRDAILMVSGSLDATVGGEHPFPPQRKWNFTQHVPFLADYDSNRRSVYLMVQRIKCQPYLTLFDGADPNECTGERSESTTPLQALFFMNDSFVHEQSAKFAARLMNVGKDDRQRIVLSYQLALGRPPSEPEIISTDGYLRKYLEGLKTTDIPSLRYQESAWASCARVLFSSNEFNYVD